MKAFFRFLKNLFRQIQPGQKVTSASIPLNFTPVLGFIAPHTKMKQGATSYLGISEYHYGCSMLRMLPYPYETRDEAGVYGASKMLVIKGCNVTIETHFNSFNTKAEGYEILVLKGDTASKNFAVKVLKEFETKYPDRVNRGLKEVRVRDRGGRNLKAARDAGAKISILTEMFFGDNPKDHLSIIDQREFWSNLKV